MRKKPDAIDFIKHRPALSLTMGVLMFIIGILISDLPRMIVSTGWPTTDGNIVSCRLIAHRFKEYDGDFYTEINAYIRYEYVVDGVRYSSLSINAIDSNFYPYDIGKRYSKGEEVLVYYNPKNPSEAVLEPGFVGIFKGFDVYSYFFFGAGLYFLYLGISRIKATSNRSQE